MFFSVHRQRRSLKAMATNAIKFPGMPGYDPGGGVGGGVGGRLRERLRRLNLQSAGDEGTEPYEPRMGQFDRLTSFSGDVSAVDPMSSPLFARRRLRAMGNVTRGAQEAGRTYQRQTGLGAGTAGGAAQASLLNLLGASEAEMVGDELATGERNYLTDLERGNVDRRLSALLASVGAEGNINQLGQQESQFARSLEEQQREFDEVQGIDDNFDENNLFIEGPPYGDPDTGPAFTNRRRPLSTMLTQYGRQF